MHVRYYHFLYWEDGLEKKKDKIIRRLNEHKFMLDLYLVVLSQGKVKRLEIINSIYLLQKNYPDKEKFVIGIAGSYEGALEIVKTIVEETYEDMKNTDTVNYILKREQEG